MIEQQHYFPIKELMWKIFSHSSAASVINMIFVSHEVRSWTFEYLNLEQSYLLRRECFNYIPFSQLIPHLSKIHAISLSTLGLLDDDLPSLLNVVPKIQKIDLSYCKNFTENAINCLPYFSKLKSLNITGAIITDEQLAYFHQLPHLTKINLSLCSRVTSIGIQALTQLKNLKHLALNRCYAADENFTKYIKKIPTLKTLKLNFCKQLNHNAIKNIRKLSLNCLTLRMCTSISDAALVYLGQINSLEYLDLSGCHRITNEGLSTLSNLTNLKKINLTNCASLESIETLSNYLSVTNLNLTRCQNIRQLPTDFFITLTRLIKLDMTSTKINNLYLQEWSKLTSLEILLLKDCTIVSSKMLAHLPHQHQLRILNLRGCINVDDSGLKKISKSLTLKELDISFCNKITANGLEFIKKIKTLRKLKLISCHLISNDDLDRYKRESSIQEVIKYSPSGYLF